MGCTFGPAVAMKQDLFLATALMILCIMFVYTLGVAIRPGNTAASGINADHNEEFLNQDIGRQTLSSIAG